MSQQKVESPLFQQGLKDGLPICLGYISVAFTFGMMATEGGLAPWSSLLISMTNLTSAGQFAGTALILSGGTLLEIAVTTFVINIRYMLMSLSLSQKLDPDMKMAERLILSFGVTDEVFAVAIRQRKELTARYLAGLILTPYAGWALGTVLGATATGALMVCLVGNGDELPHSGELVKRLREDLPCLESVVFNSNRGKTNVILGKRCQALWGKDGIVDHLCGLSFFLSPLSFYQVNRDQAEILYRLAGEYASLQKEDTVLDLYCGTGTIGMTMASKAGKVIGVEVVPDAIEDAKANAVRNGVKNIEFICGDSAQAVQMLRKRGERPTVVVVDPPRKGCGLPVLEHIVEIAPRKIVYVSCDPATLARDLKLLVKAGYCLQTLVPVDLFPRTAHVETVALLEKADINLKN